MSEIRTIKKLEQIKNILEKALKDFGYFEIILKNGTYLNFLGENVIIEYGSEYIYIKEKDYKGNPIIEAFIKPANIKEILPKEI